MAGGRARLGPGAPVGRHSLERLGFAWLAPSCPVSAFARPGGGSDGRWLGVARGTAAGGPFFGLAVGGAEPAFVPLPCWIVPAPRSLVRAVPGSEGRPGALVPRHQRRPAAGSTQPRMPLDPGSTSGSGQPLDPGSGFASRDLQGGGDPTKALAGSDLPRSPSCRRRRVGGATAASDDAESARATRPRLWPVGARRTFGGRSPGPRLATPLDTRRPLNRRRRPA